MITRTVKSSMHGGDEDAVESTEFFLVSTEETREKVKRKDTLINLSYNAAGNMWYFNNVRPSRFAAQHRAHICLVADGNLASKSACKNTSSDIIMLSKIGTVGALLSLWHIIGQNTFIASRLAQSDPTLIEIFLIQPFFLILQPKSNWHNKSFCSGWNCVNFLVDKAYWVSSAQRRFYCVAREKQPNNRLYLI